MSVSFRCWKIHAVDHATHVSQEHQGVPKREAMSQFLRLSETVGLNSLCAKIELYITTSIIIIISFAIRQFQMNPTKPSFDMTTLYSYRDECTLNTNQL